MTNEELFESSRKAIFETNAQSCEYWNQINEKSKEANPCDKCPNNKANNPNASGICHCASPCFANPIT